MNTIFKTYLRTKTEDPNTLIRVTVNYSRDYKRYTLHAQPLTKTAREGGYSIEEYDPMNGYRCELLRVERKSKKSEGIALAKAKEILPKILDAFKGTKYEAQPLDSEAIA